MDKTLWPLQVAIEQYLEHRGPTAPTLSSPATVPDPGHEVTTPAGDEHETGNAETAPGHEVVDPNASDEGAPEDNPTQEPDPVETTHNPVAGEPHGINGESHDADETPVEPVAVVVAAVVDSYYLKQANEEDEEQAAALTGDAQRRERVVRREIHNALVANNLMQALPSDEANEELARQSVVDNNSAALSKELCATVGASLGAEILICVLIDRDGAEVNVAAQVAATGEMIYQDALVDWEPAVKAIEQEPAE